MTSRNRAAASFQVNEDVARRYFRRREDPPAMANYWPSFLVPRLPIERTVCVYGNSISFSYLWGKPIERSEAVAGGWTRDGAVQDQIDDTVKDAVQFARARMPAGDGKIHCVECGEEIPEARRRALPGARTCVPCQTGRDTVASFSAFNRRGSKDSQLR